MAEVGFVNTTLVKSMINIDSSVNDKILAAVITSAEDSYLQRVLGTTLYEKLKTNIANSTLTTKQSYLINNKIIKYLLATVQFLAIDDLLVKYSQNSTYASTPNNTTQLNIDQITRIQFNKQRDMATYEALIKSYIKQNSNDFPEYESETGIEATKTKNFGFYISDDKENDLLYNEKTGTYTFDETL